MRIDPIKQDLIFFILLVAIIVGLPFGIRAYDRHLELKEITNGANPINCGFIETCTFIRVLHFQFLFRMHCFEKPVLNICTL